MASVKTNKIILFGISLASIVATGTSVLAQTSGAPVLSQNSITVGLGQTMTITAQGSTGVYMSYSSNSSVASIVTNGTQISVTGNQPGSATASICYVGTSSSCTNLSVSVQSGL